MLTRSGSCRAAVLQPAFNTTPGGQPAALEALSISQAKRTQRLCRESNGNARAMLDFSLRRMANPDGWCATAHARRCCLITSLFTFLLMCTTIKDQFISDLLLHLFLLHIRVSLKKKPQSYHIVIRLCKQHNEILVMSPLGYRPHTPMSVCRPIYLIYCALLRAVTIIRLLSSDFLLTLWLKVG